MPKHAAGPNSGKDRKTKGRTAITSSSRLGRSTDPGIDRRLKVEATRPIEAGGTKHRGDRRDMSKTYTGTQKHKTRGNNAKPDVKTRQR
jgi:hypothetical protein